MPVNNQDRNKQPLRAGGNSPDKQIEDHGSPRGEEIANTPAEKLGQASPGRREFRGHGDTSILFHGHSGVKPGDASIEKHGQKKDMGKKSVGGKIVGAAPSVSSEVEVEPRGHAGNSKDGNREHQMCHGGSEKISAKVNRS